jgi:hypothetical protein
MRKKPQAAPQVTRDSETTEEIIGILYAISVVSRRLAKKLSLLEQQIGRQGGGAAHA